MRKRTTGLVVVIVLAGLVYGLLSYQLVTSENGMYVRKKPELGLSDMVVEEKGLERFTRKLTGSIDELGKRTRKEWKKLSAKLDDLGKDSSLDNASEDFREAVEDLQKDVRKRYDKLARKWENGDISTEKFQKQLSELNDWAAKKMEKLKDKFKS